MEIDDFLAPRVVIVSGKGGVGKTTISAALALVAARRGRQVCVAEVDRKGSLPRLFDEDRLGYEPRQVAPGVWGMSIVPDEALAEYLDVQYHMKRIARIFSSSHFVDYITATAPGLKDILVLGKIWYLEQGRTKGGVQFDTIIVDAPAAGHMLQFLSAPTGLSDAVKVGPVRRQASWLAEMLRDHSRTRVHLVTIPEEMPVVETIETAEALLTKLDIEMGPVFANAVYPELLTKGEKKEFDEIMADGDPDELRGEAARIGLRLEREDLDSLVGYADFLGARREIQSKHLRRLRKEVEQPVIELPHLLSAGVDLPGLERIADAMEEGVEAL